MKDRLVDILVFLFETYFANGFRDVDEKTFSEDLFKAGFTSGEINKAFDWFGALSKKQKEFARRPFYESQTGFRIYSEIERSRLSNESASFLFHLEQKGYIDVNTRELIMDMIILVDENDISLSDFKAIIGLIIFGCREKEYVYLSRLLRYLQTEQEEEIVLH